MKLRVGRSNGRTIYLQAGDEPASEDPMVGTMDTAILAEAVVLALNAAYSPRDLTVWLTNHAAAFDLDVERQRPR